MTTPPVPPGNSGADQLAIPMRLSAQQIEHALDDSLAAVLSSRRTAEEVAQGLAALTAEQQQFALRWTDIISKSNSEMAYQFVSHMPTACAALDLEGTRQWLLRAMDIYDQQGLYPGSAAFARIEEFAREYRLSHIAVTLDEVRAVLESFVRALSGRNLKLNAGERTYTDTETLYLPARIQHFAQRAQNRRLYKAMAVHLWAQTWFGTFRRAHADAPHLAQHLAQFDDPRRARQLFNLLETIRLNACIARELPGLAREMLTVDAGAPTDGACWQKFSKRLQHAKAEVADTLVATAALYPLPQPWPATRLYQGELDLDAARMTLEARMAAEKNQLQTRLMELLADSQPNHNNNDNDTNAPLADLHPRRENRFEIDSTREDAAVQIKLDGAAIAPPEITKLLSSMLQDVAQLPPEWLSPAGYGGYEHKPQHERPDNAPPQAQNDASGADDPPEKVFRYDEWDFRRQSYRKNWCCLREQVTHPLYDDFVEQTMRKYLPLVADIRRHFEALRGERKLLKAQTSGDNIDLDALITAHADAHSGREMSERLFTRMNKVERNLAALFMVDISGSTKGWINDAERESLVLLCEALEILGDRYAIYGFSGMTRNRCEIHRIKTFAQPYDRDTRARISGLRPQDYTRMGVAIRHLSDILNQAEARTRILITLSDGKPDDYDGYRGAYGIEDTRQALWEARQAGIHPFCITIDNEARDYLSHMYGYANYAVVDEVRKLPLKVADIYRQLTT